MIEILLDDNVPIIRISYIIGLITFLSDEVCLSLTLISKISFTTSSTEIIIIVIIVNSFLWILLELFRHTILLEMTYLIASSASNIDASS